MLFKGLRTYLAVFFFVMLFASASLAAANGPGLPSDTINQTMHPTNDVSIKTSLGIDSKCSTGYGLAGGDMPVGSMNGCFNDSVAIPLLKNGDKSIWSIAPSISKFSLNPIDDIKRVQVMLQFSFSF